MNNSNLPVEIPESKELSDFEGRVVEFQVGLGHWFDVWPDVGLSLLVTGTDSPRVIHI